jgi:uncharacterized MAPEG superfamily protein
MQRQLVQAQLEVCYANEVHTKIFALGSGPRISMVASYSTYSIKGTARLLTKETKITREIREKEEHKKSNHVKETYPQFLYSILTALRTGRTVQSTQQLISHIWVFSDTQHTAVT